MNPSGQVNILLVDDEPANLLVLEAVLGDLGQRLVKASSGEEALHKVLDMDFAAILLDVRMPTLSGFETARLIRSRPRSKSTPILFLTAFDGDGFTVEKAYELGAVDYLTKPVVPAVLRAKVAFFVELRRKTDELAQAERARHAAALGEKDERIRLILDNMRDYAFILSSPDGRVTEWEGGARAITGWSPAEAIGQPGTILFTPEDREAGVPEAEMRRARETGRSLDKRWHLRKDGTHFFADGVMVPLNDAAGRLRGYAKIFRDATAERKASDELRESRERFALLLESSGEGIFGMGPDGACTFLNAAAAAMVGFQPGELVGHPIHDLIHHHHADGTPYPLSECRILKAARIGIAIRADDEVFFRKDGTQVPVAYSVNPMIVDGKSTGAVITSTDITERRRAEAERERLLREVQAASERMTDVFRQAPAFMCVLRGPEHVFELVNDRYLALVGPRELVGKPVREALPEIAGQVFCDRLDRVYQTGEPFVSTDGRVLLARHSGQPLEERFVDFVYLPLRDSDGAVSGILVHGVDLTERKRAEEGLRQLAADLSEADRRKTEFLATLAHELRNPLAPLGNGLQIMRLSPGDPATVARARSMMERQLNHMVHLVNDLLDIARITRGKVDLRKSRVDLSTVVSSAIETSQPAIEAASHELVVRLPEEPLPIEADPTRLAQVLANLLHNAAKYTPSGGHIELVARRNSDEVEVAVTDTGIGIPAESLPTVFEMFTQVGRSLDRAQGGLGIGLTLVRRLVELHGGTVTATSPGAGKGSTFMIRMPLAGNADKDNASAPQQSSGKTAAVAQKFKVLVVDDNQDGADTLAALLEILGHSTRVANDGERALIVAKEFAPDVIFLDIGMPGMNGYEVARAVRKEPQIQGVVLVALTGWGAESDRARTKEAGFDHHLTKPAELSAVEGLLNKLGRAPRAT